MTRKLAQLAFMAVSLQAGRLAGSYHGLHPIASQVPTSKQQPSAPSRQSSPQIR